MLYQVEGWRRADSRTRVRGVGNSDALRDTRIRREAFFPIGSWACASFLRCLRGSGSWVEPAVDDFSHHLHGSFVRVEVRLTSGFEQ